MHEVTGKGFERLDGISILVGTAQCNANCRECAGRQHRKNAPLKDGELDVSRLREALDYCHERRCHYVTLTGCGEPTLSPESVTKALETIHEYAERGITFHPVNLYTNGIRIGNDIEFCSTYLPRWKRLGLTRVYVSVYSADEALNADAFRVKTYPPFEFIFKRIRWYGLKVRVSVILKKGYTDDLNKFQSLCKKFFSMGVSNVTAWPLKDEDDYISPLAPEDSVLQEIADYGKTRPDRIRVLLGSSSSKDMLGKKIALFQNGEISDTWCARR